ncbi:TIGR03013 family XrtA/PEP-CTERM system glycosyltransferase [Desulfocurvibacter africanus]|uniref:TIGR03013 family XrtA/PEP-CTERM system glycosyltransferase n=1 Tax=Desulfocurvibacter africanus TaxID=873 RepID=UPI000427F6B9|nr:TIGR03013 family XrtA/PEP-CTERM system glycosyltransferase [Desulfocurvibacter africanus]
MQRSFLPLLTLDATFALASLYVSSALHITPPADMPASINPILAVTFLGIATSSGIGLEVCNSSLRTAPGKKPIRALTFFLLGFFILTLLRSTRVISPQDWILGSTALIGFGILQFCCHRAYKCINARARRQVIVVGTGSAAKRIGDMLALEETRGKLLGYVTLPAEPMEVSQGLIVGPQEDLTRIIEEHGAKTVVVALSERRGALPLQELLSCKMTGVAVVDAPTFYEQVQSKMLIENISPGWLIFSDGFRITPIKRHLKRSLDILCALSGLLLTLPLFPILALLIKIDSRGPVFFTQTRVGEHDKLFKVIKFRTMVHNAEATTGAVWSQKGDPRVTRVGRFLRVSRLDEIPQLLNMLRGDMSMVGPRPERPEFVQTLKRAVPFYSERHCVKPGLTGWAQVCYPYGSSVEDALEKLRYDLYYIKNFSLVLDLRIILRTVGVVLFGKGGR